MWKKINYHFKQNTKMTVNIYYHLGSETVSLSY